MRIDRQAAGSLLIVMSFLFGLGLAALVFLRLVVAILAGLF